MQINSVTRQSGLLAAVLLLAIVVANVAVAAAHATSAGVALWLHAVVVAAVLFTTGMLVGRMSIKGGIFRTFCTLPIPMFGIVACGAHLDIEATNVAYAAFCLAVALLLFSESLHAPEAKNPIFFGSILLGGAALLYPPCIVLVVLLPAAAVIASQSVRQMAIALIGWLLPIFAVSYVSWYAGGDFFGTVRSFGEQLSEPQPFATFERLPIIAIAIFAIVGLLIVAGIVLRSMDNGAMLAGVRKSLQMLAFVVVALLGACALPCCTIAIVPIVAVPAAVLASFTLESGRTDIATIVYWLLLLLSVLNLFVW